MILSNLHHCIPIRLLISPCNRINESKTSVIEIVDLKRSYSRSHSISVSVRRPIAVIFAARSSPPLSPYPDYVQLVVPQEANIGMSAMRRWISRDITFSRQQRSSKSQSPGNPANRTSGESPFPRSLAPRCNLQSALARRGPRSLARTSRCSDALASTLYGMLIGPLSSVASLKRLRFAFRALPYQHPSLIRISSTQPFPRKVAPLSRCARRKLKFVKFASDRNVPFAVCRGAKAWIRSSHRATISIDNS